MFSIGPSLLNDPSTFLTCIGLSNFFNLNPFFLANSELMTNPVAPLSNNASTVIPSCVSSLSNPILIASPKRIVIHFRSSLIYWTVYSKIDLHHAYHLVRIADGDEWKTAFRICYRSFEWSVMPFGLTNAPAAFQQFMNDIFSDLLDVCVMIYLDDILIYSNNMSEHHRDVKEVLKHLRKTGLYAKAEKCEFHSESVKYLGYILSPSGFTMSDDKIKIIQDWPEPKKVKDIQSLEGLNILDWPEPKKVKDIQSFLGFANFYRRFIFNYSDIVIPLTRLTRKDIPWKFDSSCQDAFNSLKKAFTSTPILTHWIPDAQLIVETNASDYALAVILSIVNEDNEVHPVAFHSRTFTAWS